MNRKPFLAANWKMNLGVAEALKYVTQFVRQPALFEDIDVVLCPPFTTLYTTSVALQDTGVKLAAQNCYFEDAGAFTGEISPAFLQEVGCEYVIIGHSERRQIFKESNEDIARKLVKAMQNDLIPIFCVGETESERETGTTFTVIQKQLQAGLAALDKSMVAKLVIAYEPVWAIGTGKTATPAQAGEVHGYIRDQLAQLHGTAIAAEMRLIYGGSVKPDNMRALMSQADIDGALVGGASLKPESFLEIINQANSAFR